MLTDGFIVTAKQCCQLLTRQPYHFTSHPYIQLNSIILIFVDYNFLIFFHN